MIEPINLLLPFSKGFDGENSPSNPISSDEDFDSFLMRQGSLLKGKTSDQSGQLVNDQVPSMIVATLFSPQEGVPPSAPSSETQSGEQTSAMAISSDLTEYPTATLSLFLLNQEGTFADPTQDTPPLGQEGGIPGPLEAEEFPTVPPQSYLLPNQNDLISGLPFFEQSIDPATIKPESPGFMETPRVMPAPPSPMDGVPFISVQSLETEPLRQNPIMPQSQLILNEEGFNSTNPSVAQPLDPVSIEPQSQLTLNEEGFNSSNPSVAQSLDPVSIESPLILNEEGFNSTNPSVTQSLDPVSIKDCQPESAEPQLSGLQKSPVQTIDFVTAEPPKPAERVILGEQNRLSRDEAFIVDLSNREAFIGEARASGEEGSSSLVQNSLVPPRVNLEQGMVSENVNRDPLSSKPSLPPEQGSFQPFSIHESIAKDAKGDLLKEGTDFRPDPRTVEAMNQKTEKSAFPPEAPFTTEKRAVTNSFEQQAGEVKGELWAKSESPAISGTKDTESVDQSWMFTGHKAGAEFQSKVPEEISKGQEQLLPKTEPLEIFQQIAKRVVWSINNNGEKIKLTLDPPELGNIYMEINREKGNIRATLWADNPVTKGILEANQIQFYRIMEKGGFHLEKFNVFIQPESGSFQERGENPIEYGRWGRGKYKEEKGSLSQEPLEINTMMNLPHRGSQYVDLFV